MKQFKQYGVRQSDRSSTMTAVEQSNTLSTLTTSLTMTS